MELLKVNELIAIGLNDYECQIAIDKEAKKIISVTTLEQVNEEDDGIKIKANTLIKNNKYGINYKELLNDLYGTLDENGDFAIVIE